MGDLLALRPGFIVAARRAGAALLILGVLLLASGCRSTPPAGQDHRIVPRAGTPAAGLTPLAMPEPGDLPPAPGGAETPEAPIGTLPPRIDPQATVTSDPAVPTPDGTLYSRLVYTYTAGIRPIKLVLDIRPDGSARAVFGPQQRAGTLSPGTMAAISAALRSANVFALQDEYRPARACCDLPAHEITVFTQDGRSKTIDILGAAPAPLVPLVEALGGIWRDLPVVE